LNELTAKQRK